MQGPAQQFPLSKVFESPADRWSYRSLSRMAASACLVLTGVALSWLTTAELTAEEHDASRWEKDIAAFEAKDAQQPISPGGILFVGSSSIRRWDTGTSFPNHVVINRGFGGSQMADVLHYVDRVVLCYQPKLIVLYEGDNDIAKGKKPSTVLAEFKQLKARVHDRLPETKIVFLSIKPSLKRWDIYETMKEANDGISAVCARDPRCEFIDVSQVMLGPDGKPLPELFVDDGLHLNDKGYARWTKLVLPHLGSEADSR